MFARVTIGVSDPGASEAFYRTVLGTLGEPARDFRLAPAADPDGVTRRLHVGFAAQSRAHVDAFWRAGVDAGYRDDGSPGPRPQYRHDYYGGFLLDPDGNSAEAVHHGAVRSAGWIDHLWLRVADLTASRRFYEGVAPHAGFRIGTDTQERISFRAEDGSFSLVRGTPTANVELAFAALSGAAALSTRDPDGNRVEVGASLTRVESANEG